MKYKGKEFTLNFVCMSLSKIIKIWFDNEVYIIFFFRLLFKLEKHCSKWGKMELELMEQ